MGERKFLKFGKLRSTWICFYPKAFLKVYHKDHGTFKRYVPQAVWWRSFLGFIIPSFNQLKVFSELRNCTLHLTLYLSTLTFYFCLHTCSAGCQIFLRFLLPHLAIFSLLCMDQCGKGFIWAGGGKWSQNFCNGQLRLGSRNLQWQLQVLCPRAMPGTRRPHRKLKHQQFWAVTVSLAEAQNLITYVPEIPNYLFLQPFELYSYLCNSTSVTY